MIYSDSELVPHLDAAMDKAFLSTFDLILGTNNCLETDDHRDLRT